MKNLKFPLIALLTAGLLTIAFIGCKKDSLTPSLTSAAKGGGTVGAYDPVTLSCATTGFTQHSIGLVVTAGPSGAPAGFSIQWMKKTDLDALNGVWPDYDATTGNFCKASFSGVPYGSKNTAQAGTNSYNLPSNGSVTVYIGDLLNDDLNQQLGLSTTCNNGVLDCGTQYVFRAFAHGDSKKNRSIYTIYDNDCAATDACGDCGRHGYGYWKNDSLAVANIIDPTGDNSGTLLLGDQSYTSGQIYAILNQTPNGNGLVILAHQLISAKLNNICNTDWGTADAMFDGKIVPPVGTSSVTANTVAGQVATLQKINNTCVQCGQSSN